MTIEVRVNKEDVCKVLNGEDLTMTGRNGLDFYRIVVGLDRPSKIDLEQSVSENKN